MLRTGAKYRAKPETRLKAYPITLRFGAWRRPLMRLGTGVYLAVGLLGDAPLFHLACGPDSTYDYKFVSAAKSLAYTCPTRWWLCS